MTPRVTVLCVLGCALFTHWSEHRWDRKIGMGLVDRWDRKIGMGIKKVDVSSVMFACLQQHVSSVMLMMMIDDGDDD